MVLSTLHTNSAPDTIARMLNMGVESFNLVAALTCVTAQRLMRRICERCRIVDESVTPQVMVELGIHPQYAARVRAYNGAGCPACGNSGNKGRIAVHEKIKKIAMATGMRTLRQSALNKMVQGISDATEVIKTTNSDSDDDPRSESAA
jgi:type IV pilus assembly protein PilB